MSARKTEASVDAEADRKAILISAKAQIASSRAILRAGRVSIDTTKEVLEESQQRIKADTARYEALAQKHGADLSEKDVKEARGKFARYKPSARK